MNKNHETRRNRKKALATILSVGFLLQPAQGLASTQLPDDSLLHGQSSGENILATSSDALIFSQAIEEAIPVAGGVAKVIRPTSPEQEVSTFHEALELVAQSGGTIELLQSISEEIGSGQQVTISGNAEVIIILGNFDLEITDGSIHLTDAASLSVWGADGVFKRDSSGVKGPAIVHNSTGTLNLASHITNTGGNTDEPVVLLEGGQTNIDGSGNITHHIRFDGNVVEASTGSKLSISSAEFEYASFKNTGGETIIKKNVKITTTEPGMDAVICDGGSILFDHVADQLNEKAVITAQHGDAVFCKNGSVRINIGHFLGGDSVLKTGSSGSIFVSFALMVNFDRSKPAKFTVGNGKIKFRSCGFSLNDMATKGLQADVPLRLLLDRRSYYQTNSVGSVSPSQLGDRTIYDDLASVEAVQAFRTGSSSFHSLRDAMLSVPSGTTIQLFHDADLDESLLITKDITIDLNGHAFDFQALKLTINHEKTIRIKDSSSQKTGRLFGNAALFEMQTTGKLILEDGITVGAEGKPAKFNIDANQQLEVNRAKFPGGVSLSDTILLKDVLNNPSGNRAWYLNDEEQSGETSELLGNVIVNHKHSVVRNKTVGGYPLSYTYNGNEIPTPLLDQFEIIGNVDPSAVFFSWEGFSGTEKPKNPGTYTLKIYVAGNADYKETEQNFSVVIEKISLQITDITAVPKVFDGSRSAQITSATFKDAQNQSVALSIGSDYQINSAEYDDANAGVGKQITVRLALNTEFYELVQDQFILPTGIILQATTPDLHAQASFPKDSDSTEQIDLTNISGYAEHAKLGTNMQIVSHTDNGLRSAQIGSDGKTLMLQTRAGATAADTVTIRVSSTNYADFMITLAVNYTDTTVPVPPATNPGQNQNQNPQNPGQNQNNNQQNPGQNQNQNPQNPGQNQNNNQQNPGQNQNQNPQNPGQNQNPQNPGQNQNPQNPGQNQNHNQQNPGQNQNHNLKGSYTFRSNSLHSKLPANYKGEVKLLHKTLVPAAVVEGQWKQNAESGKWTLDVEGKNVADTWQLVYLPSDSSNMPYRWFAFDEHGEMRTGFYTSNGHTYYLNPAKDSHNGELMTGWQNIDGKWYYFNPEFGASMGQLLKSATTPDGYTVDANGIWIP